MIGRKQETEQLTDLYESGKGEYLGTFSNIVTIEDLLRNCKALRLLPIYYGMT